MKTLINTFKHRQFGLFLLLIVCDTFSQVLFKSAALKTGPASLESISTFWQFVQAVLVQPALIVAVLLLLIAFACWMLLISETDLSKAHLISCLSYATVPLCAVWLFADHLTVREMCGIGLITLGAVVSSLH